MWILTIRSAGAEPSEHVLKPGVTTIGRKAGNDIAIPEVAASRRHAELTYALETNAVFIRDLDSTNGTYVNRERLVVPRRLTPGDEIRIGHHVISIDERERQRPLQTEMQRTDTRPLTRELLLESLDRHAVLLSEVAERLTTVLDLDTALREVSSLMRRSMGADKCEVILAERFDRLHELGFPVSIARLALDQRSAVLLPDVSSQLDGQLARSALLLRIRSALCVPVMSGDEIVALIYVYKTMPGTRPFDQRDLQLGVAISHQAALTIQRTRLLRRVRREQRMRELLQRFLAPTQAEFLLQDYLKTGRLPALDEQRLTVLFIDIRDSTGLAERLGARAFSTLLTRYYHGMTEITFDHGGMMHQYIGDGLMAVFGMFDKTNQEEHAVRAGLAMLRERNAIEAEGDTIEVGIGINTGPAVAGYLEIRDRIEFSVLGDTVNVSERLQGQARPNRLLVGPDTFAAVAGRFNMREVGPLEVKGRQKPIDVYEVLPV